MRHIKSSVDTSASKVQNALTENLHNPKAERQTMSVLLTFVAHCAKWMSNPALVISWPHSGWKNWLNIEPQISDQCESSKENYCKTLQFHLLVPLLSVDVTITWIYACAPIMLSTHYQHQDIRKLAMSLTYLAIFKEYKSINYESIL